MPRVTEPRPEHLRKWEHVELIDAEFDEMLQQELAYRQWREKIDQQLEREA